MQRTVTFRNTLQHTATQNNTQVSVVWAEDTSSFASTDSHATLYLQVCCSVFRCVCSVLHCVTLCCSVLQCVCISFRQYRFSCDPLPSGLLQSVAECCSVLHCVAYTLHCVVLCCIALRCVYVLFCQHGFPPIRSYTFRFVAVCCGVLQRTAAYCSMLQRFSRSCV